MINLFIIYSLITFFLLFICGKVSYKLNLVDFPNKRKIHLKPTAYTGGIVISIILIISLKLFGLAVRELNLIVSLSFLISIVGIIDDKFHLNTGGKLSLQVFTVFYLIAFENLYLSNIGDYNFFKLELGTFGMPFSVLSILFLINSFNYFDGIDGTLSFSLISVLCILYYLVPSETIKLYMLIIIIPISIFLCFNFSLLKLPKLFLGDSGSLLLGFIISFLLIYLNNKAIVHPILLAWSIVIFVYEFLSINILRLIKKKALFKAGQDHLHHVLYKKTNSIFLTNCLIFVSNIILFSCGYLSFLVIGSLSSLILFIALFICFLLLRNKYSELM
tara:strand:+ start:1504 stop:2499 length:996 start_codon:yes stop_codon:yes gene_type:complete